MPGIEAEPQDQLGGGDTRDRFEDKVVIVTGAGSGIGEALAEGFGEEGAQVVLAEFSDENGERVEAELQAEGIDAEYIQTDVGDKSSTEAMVERVVDDYGRIDVLINNAGIARDKSLLGMSEQQWHEVLQVHGTGLFNATQPVARVMADQETLDAIVNASSISATTGNKGQFNYTFAKGGIDAATRTAAIELASKGIRVNAVRPGLTETAMTQEMDQGARQIMEAGILLGRVATPKEDIVPAYMFLASDEARYITGTTLNVDGGIMPASPQMIKAVVSGEMAKLRISELEELLDEQGVELPESG